jgi:hypothetical protein
MPNFSMEDLAAEIEYVLIRGTQYAARECVKCNQGVPNQEQSRCETCLKNQYLDDLQIAGGACQDCPPGTFSPTGSIGAGSC